MIHGPGYGGWRDRVLNGVISSPSVPTESYLHIWSVTSLVRTLDCVSPQTGAPQSRPNVTKRPRVSGFGTGRLSGSHDSNIPVETRTQAEDLGGDGSTLWYPFSELEKCKVPGVDI